MLPCPDRRFTQAAAFLALSSTAAAEFVLFTCPPIGYQANLLARNGKMRDSPVHTVPADFTPTHGHMCIKTHSGANDDSRLAMHQSPAL
ncbi:unnamed protein product [Protopolystoma xenopodis]|uniref:Secreted protein n=1 Tax=Protopolystoma xenopodis TaxID=117903 RepID=A0A448WKP2_9PLAT|nr:unnamed protein product [Protopolystoma xenopodis]